jgi:hypothetical protein
VKSGRDPAKESHRDGQPDWLLTHVRAFLTGLVEPPRIAPLPETSWPRLAGQ